MEFVRHERFGWLTMCPSKIGTTIQCEVSMKIEQSMIEKVEEICDKFQLKTNAIGENAIEISNKRCFGLSEFDCVKGVYYGVKEIVRLLNVQEKNRENELNEEDKPENETGKSVGQETEEINPDKQENNNEIEKEENVQLEVENDPMTSLQSTGTYTKETSEDAAQTIGENLGETKDEVAKEYVDSPTVFDESTKAAEAAEVAPGTE